MTMPECRELLAVDGERRWELVAGLDNARRALCEEVGHVRCACFDGGEQRLSQDYWHHRHRRNPIHVGGYVGPFEWANLKGDERS